MDSYDASTISLLSGMFSSMLIFVAAFVLVVPIIILGMMFYYFTGDKKHGKRILANLMNIGLRIYNHSWMFIASLVGLIGFEGAFGYILDEIFDTQSIGIDDAEPFVRGILYLILAIILFGIHFAVNYFVQGKQQKKVTMVTKLFLTFGIIVYSIITFLGSIQFIEGLLTEIYYEYSEGEELVNAVSLLLPSIILWAGYITGAWRVYKVENQKTKK